MKEYRNRLGLLRGAALMLLVAQPLQSASAQIRSTQTPTPQTKPSIVQTPAAQPLVPNPEITIDGNPAPASGIVQPVVPAPPFLPRAVAPPVGDIAISNFDSSPDLIDLGTAVLVPRLVLREAPVREVLGLLARSAGLNLVFTEVQGDPEAVSLGPTISLDLENEPVQDVFNTVLNLSGLQANRRGNTIFVGPILPDAARNLISRTLRLNQVEAESAAAFLASQGAEAQQLVIPIREIIDPETNRVVQRIEDPAVLQPLTVIPEEGSLAPLLLTGLAVSNDDRLNSITLVGDPRKVEIATSLLTQLDARRRQAAVNVKVIDINLDNTFRFGTSFSFGIDDTGVINQSGIGIINFGTNDGNLEGFPPAVPPAEPNEGEIAPFQTDIDPESIEDSTVRVEPPGSENFNVANAFLLQLRSSIQNRNAKILTDPTLIVQEGQEATVKLVQNIVESVQTSVDPLSGVRTTTPVIGEVGLTLNVVMDRIDDNGFVGLAVSPIVSSPGLPTPFNSGGGAVNNINLVQRRELNSGLVRLRDGNTLVLSGIIQESERETVRKIPVFGDLPLIGSLFRSSGNDNQRTEVVVLLTPRIVDEDSSFGYNYTPGREAGEMLQQRGFPIQGNQ